MRVEMRKSEFDSCDGASLIWACVEPVIKEIRGKSLNTKKAASAGLNESQRALLMFQVLLGHSGDGVGSLFLQLSYMLSDRSVWNEFGNSAQLFNDERLLVLYGRMEETYFGSVEKTPDLLDIELQQTVPESVRIAASFIRCNPEQFVRFVD